MQPPAKVSAIGRETADVNAMIWAREMVSPSKLRVIRRSVTDVSDSIRSHAPLDMEQEFKMS